MDIQIIPIESLSLPVYRKLIKLNLGNRGVVKLYLKSAYNSDESRLKYRRNEQAILLTSNNRILCWLLVLDSRKCCGCKWRKTVHIYTRKSERGKGYARILIKQAIDMFNPIRLYCSGNGKFFNKYGIKYA